MNIADYPSKCVDVLAIGQPPTATRLYGPVYGLGSPCLQVEDDGTLTVFDIGRIRALAGDANADPMARGFAQALVCAYERGRQDALKEVAQ